MIGRANTKASDHGSGRTLDIRSSPHILSGNRVDSIMFNVVLALLPVTAFAVYAFGLTALLTLITATGACVLAEPPAQRRRFFSFRDTCPRTTPKRRSDTPRVR